MKKVLIITYYWPPCGGVSVLRNLKFSKYLPEFGWEPIVYAPKNAQYDLIDEKGNQNVNKDLTVIRHPIVEPFDAFKKLTGRKSSDSQNPLYVRDRKKGLLDRLAIWVRANFFIPDARCLWISPSVKFLKNYLSNHPVDAILTAGPPHTDTVIGEKLAKALNIPWFAFFKDPWTQVDYYKMFPIGYRADKKHRIMEQAVFKTASKIGIASPTWAKDLERIGAKNVETIYFGYDEDDFKNLKDTPQKHFSIVHAGLMGFDRSPEVLLEVLSDLKNENPAFGKVLKIKLAGLVDFSIKQKIEALGLTENAEMPGNIPRREALNELINASILLLPLNKAENAKGRLPGKLFELLRAGKPILCLGPKNSDAAQIIQESRAGVTFGYDDYNKLKQFVLTMYEHFLKHEPAYSPTAINKYSNYEQTRKLAGFLDQIS